MMVVAHHYWGFEPGYAGVGFFFVLSGYVLAINYPTVDKADFWWRRFSRIYPLHILTFLFALPLGFAVFDALPSVVLMQSWIPIRAVYFAANGPAWSISNEAFFYALFPFLLGIGGRTLAIWAAAILMLALSWAIAFPDWTLKEGGAVSLMGRTFETPLTHWLFYIFPPTRLLEFALGIYLAGIAGRVGFRAELAAITVAVVSVFALPLFPPAFAAALFFIPASVALIYVFSRSDGPVSRLLSNRTFVLLGDASFALYMIHYPLGRYLGHSIWVASLAVGLSVLIFLYFEKPMQRWLLSLGKPGNPRRAPATPKTPSL